jgi:adhesin transport system membrane fusion protein
MKLEKKLFVRVQQPMGSGVQRVLVVFVLVMGVLATWASWATLEEQIRARGKVIVSSRSQVIQIVDGGVLAKLHVKEGDKVKEGDLLAELQTVRFQASADEVATKVASLKASVSRLSAELEGVAPRFDPKLRAQYPDIVESQQRLYARRVQLQQEEQSALSRSAQLAEQELEALEKLQVTGDAALTEVIRVRRQVSEMRAMAVNKRNAYRQEAQTELAKNSSELEQAQELLTQRSEALKATLIRAPMTGVVNNIRITTLGAVLKPSDELLRIVPSDDSLLVEAKVSPTDVGFLRLGLPANVKLDAYDSSLYGSLRGNVSFISADTVEPEAGGVQRNEEPMYRVHLTIDPSELQARNKGPDVIEVIPGMTITAEIITGHRTVAQYLLKPLRRARAEALTER